MSSLLYLVVTIVILENIKISCYGVRNKVKLPGVPNIEVYLRPIKKLLDTFPNHEIELQFDISQPNVNINEETRKFHLPRASLRSVISNTTSESSTQTTKEPSTTTTDGKKVVYMEDLKKAFEELEKKLNVTVNCNQQISAKSVTIHYGSNDNQDVNLLKLLNQDGKLPKGVKKLKSDDISWLKIRVPT